MAADRRFVRFFDEIGINDVGLVGGKNASLGEMYRHLTPLGVNVPEGFAITAEAYRYMLEEAKAWALRCPVGMASADVLEIRQLTGMEDIPKHYLDVAASVAPKWLASVTKKR